MRYFNLMFLTSFLIVSCENKSTTEGEATDTTTVAPTDTETMAVDTSTTIIAEQEKEKAERQKNTSIDKEPIQQAGYAEYVKQIQRLKDTYGVTKVNIQVSPTQVYSTFRSPKEAEKFILDIKKSISNSTDITDSTSGIAIEESLTDDIKCTTFSSVTLRNFKAFGYFNTLSIQGDFTYHWVCDKSASDTTAYPTRVSKHKKTDLKTQLTGFTLGAKWDQENVAAAAELCGSQGVYTNYYYKGYVTFTFGIGSYSEFFKWTEPVTGKGLLWCKEEN